MIDSDIKSLSRETLEAEVLRLRAAHRRIDATLAAGGAAGTGPAARARRILDSIVDFAIIVTDRDGRITEWNTGAERILGWSRAAMIGHTASRFFTPEDLAAGCPAEEMRQTLERGRAADERWHLRHDGSRFWASGEMMPLCEADGTRTGFVKVLRDRTREHLADDALRTAEARLLQAQEAGGIGLFTVDVADDVLIPTPGFCRLYGLPVRDRFPAAVVEAQVIPEDRHLASTTLSRSRGETEREVEYRVRTAGTGELRWIARTGELELDEGGRPVRFVGVARDVTEQRLAREARIRSEERYRALFEAIDDGFCIVEFFDGPGGALSDYVHVEANAGYERHTGIPDIIGKTIRGFAPDEADGWVELYGAVLRTGRPVRFERYFEAAGRHIEVSAARVEPASRRQVSILFRDVDERRRAEQALRASEAVARENSQRVQLALSAGAIIGTWLWDLPTDRFTVDEAFATAFGLDPALGRDGLSLQQVVATVHPDDRQGLAQAIADAVARGGAYAHQYRVRRADGRYYWIEANGRVDHGADGTPLNFPGVVLDVEKRRAVEAERDRAAAALRSLNDTLEQRVADRTAELMRAEEQLRQSQKMEAVGQLTGGLAHDFNNLLAGVSGALEMIGMRLDQGRLGDVGKYVDAAQGATRRAAALTHRLLAFSRRQTLDPRATDINALIRDMLDLIQRTVGPSIAIETEAAAQWPTLVDPSQLENALLNLCINARDAMPDGGSIVITTADVALDAQAAPVIGLAAGEYLALSVSDTGTGMTPDIVANAFDPFFTTKPLGQGTGLGLSMIYGFAKQSGGQVRIATEPGHGTSVTLYLPRHHGDAVEPGAAGARDTPAGAGAGATVLIVDDEPSVRMLVTDLLEELGYRVLCAGDSAEGLTLLQSAVPIDLLISDVGLPGGMNGRQMAEAGRQARPALKVLFVTGYAEAAVIGEGSLDAGMQVLTKPFAMDALVARVHELTTG